MLSQLKAVMTGFAVLASLSITRTVATSATVVTVNNTTPNTQAFTVSATGGSGT